jgi:hypothetical protein
MGAQSGQVGWWILPVEMDVSPLRGVKATDAVQKRRLARPVGSDDGMHETLPDQQRNIVERHDPAESQANGFDLHLRHPALEPTAVERMLVRTSQHPTRLL